MLSLEKYEKLPDHNIFGLGLLENKFNGTFSIDEKKVVWVAYKNNGKFAIYYGGISESPLQIIESGRKITNLELVKKLVNCSKRVIKEKYDLWQ